MRTVRTVPDLATVRANLAFTCVHEADHLPPLDPEADGLFLYARHLQKRQSQNDYDEAARYYRIAAAHGHYKANRNLQLLVSQGQASSPLPQKESIELASQLIDAGVPSGYYDIGFYLNIGYGLKQDKEMALRYFRKAADLGSAEAQFYVGNLLAPLDKAPDIAKQMRECATAQGHGEAASTLGVNHSVLEHFPEAVKAFQKGTMAGNSMSASLLGKGFNGPPESNRIHYLALPYDPERSQRYKAIWEFLIRNEGGNPKVPDIDQIVPLPPAKLPTWDGTFQWEKEQAEAVPPEKPSDELIRRLSRDKGLDPASGLPLPPPPKAALGTCVSTGERCPESGLWRVLGESGAPYPDAPIYFSKGNTMPVYVFARPRLFALLDRWLGPDWVSNPVQWQLVGYDDA
ncbi:sel1 repeat family protein [Cupriavidus sp. BIS7]|uniref:SEL1-like repeat protein n=1 Tax=Cupriavidus sp. BIS7 TaxID=1217718 RepID=UPI0005683A93|nr:sel1 repeat family protein [Cupriavidus sp. BIS7]